MPEIGGKSVLVHVSHNHAVWIIKDAIWDSKSIQNRLLCKMNSDWKTLANEHSQWKSKIQGSGKFGEEMQTTISAWSCVISLSLLAWVWLWNIVSSDRDVGNSSYWKVMQCENNGDPTTLKIVQCELSITYTQPVKSLDTPSLVVFLSF